MAQAIDVAKRSFEMGGGPFGAIIVRNNSVIARGMSLAEVSNDPTAHAEVNAVRLAASLLQSIDLSDCTAYSSAEPCPMCLAAFYWARVPIVYYGSSVEDTARYGFEDDFVYHELSRPAATRVIMMRQLLRSEANSAIDAVSDAIKRETFMPDGWHR